MAIKIPIEVSARHIHLCQKDLDLLFGKGYELKKFKSLAQPNDFAAKEVLTIESKERKFENVRIVGPVREKTQVELSLTDAFYLKINPPIRISGDIKGSESVFLIGPKSKIKLKEGVIISQRHLHCSKKEAEKMNLKNGSLISVKISGKRSVVFNNVKVRSGDYKLSMHIDTDEGNASGINKKTFGIII